MNDSSPRPTAAPDGGAIELSVVMPCLNEADTLEICIGKAQAAMRAADVAGEIIVADNGSMDDSPAIAERLGARVVHIAEPGYGSALMGGIAAARGRFVIMGDADDSYDFGEIPRFLAELRAGNELVQGCRLPSGGGAILPGAMPFLHRWVGNPFFSFLARRMFHVPIHDVYCGLRGFTKDLVDRLALRCTGMEFATEMIIKARAHGAKIAEVPITLHPDGRRAHAPHLKTFRDGWRTLRFFLLLSPRWLFLYPGLLLILLGGVGYTLALPGRQIYGATLGTHTLQVAGLAILMGYQSVLFAVFAWVFAVREKLVPESPRFRRVFKTITLEVGLLAGGLMFIVGLALIAVVSWQWASSDFGPLDYKSTMRWVIPGTMLAALGFQTILSSFFVSILGMSRS